MRKAIVTSMFCALSVQTYAQPTIQGNIPEWYQRFQTPPEETQPWTFWYWMYGCVSDEGIRLDLQAMHDTGIAGFYLMPIKDTTDGKQYGGTASQLTAEWWKRMDTVFHVADSLHLQMGIHFSDGFALGGGPWITPEESMQRVVWSDTIVNGGKQQLTLALPTHKENYYQDIALYAYPATYEDHRKPQSSVTFPFKSSSPCDIIMSYDAPYTLRSVKIVTGGNNYQAHRFKVYASDNGTDYRFVREISPARQGWQNTDAYATYAIPATTARYFKFHWTPEGSDPGAEDMDAAKWKPNLKIGGIVMGSEPVIDGYEGKSGAVWRVSARYPVADNECIDPQQIINLSEQLTAAVSTGTPLTVNLPKGRWHLLRMGHTTTGHTNATGGGGKGLECDKFSREAIRKQFDHWFATIYRHAPQDVAKRVLTRLHVDSWECGSQNWNRDFAAAFKARRGYDLMPWLPLYAGVPMASSDQSDQVLRDIRLTIAELINEVFFSEMETLGKAYGCRLSCECVAPTMVSDGLLHYQHADYPMGEFWLNSPTHDKPNDMLDAISGAHIYGKNIIQAEGFTEVRGTWDEHPAMLKPLLDRNYCMGINSIVFHVNTHNPWTDRAPGMTLDGIGTFMQRDNTWWNEMQAFNTYIRRCQSLLQYGRPVVDLAVYTGDETPRRSILPERLVNTLPGLYDPQKIEWEKARLANVGQPLEVSPVGVTHTANMTKADTWLNPLQGYQYDSFNHDVLAQSRVENKELVTPGGARYRALVIPQERKMNPNRIIGCWPLIDRLEAQGLPVIRSPWTEPDLSSIHIPRDITLPDGVAYTHRQSDGCDIYFVSNQTADKLCFVPEIRTKGAYRYIADPMDGSIRSMEGEITLHPYASAFIVITQQALDNSCLENVDGTQLMPQPLTFSKPWKVEFEKNGETVTAEQLFDWSSHDRAAVKYYSGHATYTNTFKFKEKDYDRVMLDLGRVENIATVYVNDIPCGTTWMAPYQVDITKAIKKGNNQLKIVVVNTWANALQGNDEGNPPFPGIWTNGKYRRADKTLLPAGLLGPVQLLK